MQKVAHLITERLLSYTGHIKKKHIYEIKFNHLGRKSSTCVRDWFVDRCSSRQESVRSTEGKCTLN